MNRPEYLKTWEALKRGEPVHLTPEQAAGFVRAQTLEQVRAGVEAAQRKPQPLTVESLNEILPRYGGNFGIWRLFTEIVKTCKITPAAFASGLADAYTMGHADRETALLLFQYANPRQIMNAADTGRVVVSTEITRPDVLAYFNTRREREIICNVEAAPSQPVEVIAREPSGLYWDYMNGAKDFTK